MLEKLAHHLARWHAKLKHWHAVMHFGMLAHKNEKLARWHAGTLTREPRLRASMLHVDHIGTQARMARDLANSFSVVIFQLFSVVSHCYSVVFSFYIFSFLKTENFDVSVIYV